MLHFLQIEIVNKSQISNDGDNRYKRANNRMWEGRCERIKMKWKANEGGKRGVDSNKTSSGQGDIRWKSIEFLLGWGLDAWCW